MPPALFAVELIKKRHKLTQNCSLPANGLKPGEGTSTSNSETGMNTVKFHRFLKKNANDQASNRPRLLSSHLRMLCLAGTVVVLLSGVAYVLTGDSRPEPGKIPDLAKLHVVGQKLSLVAIPTVEEVLASDQLTSEYLASAFGADWKLRDHAGRYDVFRSEQYPQVLLALHVEDGKLKEACVFANRLDATPRTLGQVAGTASRLFSDVAAANDLRNWLKSSWDTPDHRSAYWSGAQRSPFKAFRFTKDLMSPEELSSFVQDGTENRAKVELPKQHADVRQSLQVVGVYLYPSHQQPPAADVSLREIGLDFREPMRRMACRLDLSPSGIQDIDG